MLILLALGAGFLQAADSPYFVTYGHRMEEPGSLEVSFQPLLGRPSGGSRFLGSLLELEYGVKTWWTTEVYLSGQSTAQESTSYTGYRWENRFRPLFGEHWINPVLYFEFANLNGADKTLKEIVGHDSEADQAELNSVASRERKREIETKLILSSHFRGWSVAENVIAEKNLANEPWEFGYAVGISRPLRLAATPRPCIFCRENFHAGVELYGGLGTRHEFGWAGTAHYVAPALAWQLPNNTTLRISPTFGVTETSYRFLLRFGFSYEITGFGRWARRGFSW